MKFRLAMMAAAMVALSAAAAFAVPKPDKAARDWELDIDLSQPQSIQVDLPGEKTSTTFWFVRYTVTNHTGEDRVFIPDFTLLTDQGQILKAQAGIPPIVYSKIKEIYTDPLLRDQTAMTGKILQGEDNAKRGVAIFRGLDTKAGGVDLFVGNLSGEKLKVELPQEIKVTEIDRKGNKVEVTKKEIVLSRTLKVQCTFPGDPSVAIPHSETPDKMILGEKTWVLR